jgi:exodeoxyribonuclease-5
VVRQKADSPILSLSQYIINSKHIKLYPGVYDNKLMIVKKEDFFKRFLPVLLKSDIVICGKNSTRDKLNEMIRDMYFKSIGIDKPLPEMMVGDKLICRKNNWILEKNGINLINGLIGRVTDIDMESSTKNVVPIDFKPDFIDAEFEDVPINMKYFKGDATTKTLIKNTPHVGELFELGYAITCHLSQGSQYEKVIVFCERMGDNDYYKKWLYTAVTRASEKLILII